MIFASKFFFCSRRFSRFIFCRFHIHSGFQSSTRFSRFFVHTNLNHRRVLNGFPRFLDSVDYSLVGGGGGGGYFSSFFREKIHPVDKAEKSQIWGHVTENLVKISDVCMISSLSSHFVRILKQFRSKSWYFLVFYLILQRGEGGDGVVRRRVSWTTIFNVIAESWRKMVRAAQRKIWSFTSKNWLKMVIVRVQKSLLFERTKIKSFRPEFYGFSSSIIPFLLERKNYASSRDTTNRLEILLKKKLCNKTFVVGTRFCC